MPTYIYRLWEQRMDNLKTRIVNSYNDLSADADSFSESSGKSRTVVEPVLRLLRKALLLDISGGEKRVPDADEIKDWVLKLFAKNPTVGDMVRALLLIKEDLVVSEHHCLLSKRHCAKSAYWSSSTCQTSSSFPRSWRESLVVYCSNVMNRTAKSSCFWPLSSIRRT